MWKRSDKLPQTPKPPQVKEILDDLALFKEDSEFEPVRSMPEDSKNIDRDFWRVFRTFMEDNKQLEVTEKALEQFKDSLMMANAEIRQAQKEVRLKIEEEKEKLRKLRQCAECNKNIKAHEAKEHEEMQM